MTTFLFIDHNGDLIRRKAESFEDLRHRAERDGWTLLALKRDGGGWQEAM